MADSAQSNVGKYKSGFGKVTREYIKPATFKIVDGYTAEQYAAQGLRRQMMPTAKK